MSSTDKVQVQASAASSPLHLLSAVVEAESAYQADEDEI